MGFLSSSSSSSSIAYCNSFDSVSPLCYKICHSRVHVRIGSQDFYPHCMKRATVLSLRGVYVCVCVSAHIWLSSSHPSFSGWWTTEPTLSRSFLFLPQLSTSWALSFTIYSIVVWTVLIELEWSLLGASPPDTALFFPLSSFVFKEIYFLSFDTDDGPI